MEDIQIELEIKKSTLTEEQIVFGEYTQTGQSRDLIDDHFSTIETIILRLLDILNLLLKRFGFNEHTLRQFYLELFIFFVLIIVIMQVRIRLMKDREKQYIAEKIQRERGNSIDSHNSG